jgi:HemX protein
VAAVFAERWVYDLIIYLYALGLLFAFADLLHKNWRANRLALSLFIAVWMIQTVFIAFRLFELFPLLTPFDSLFFYSWAIVALTLLINWLYRMDLVVFSANLVGFAVLAINFFVARDTSRHLSRLLLSELVFVHVTMAFLAYAAFSLSAVFAVLYLIGDHLLKQKKWNRLLRLLPSLEHLQRLSYGFSLIGMPLLLSSIILGVIWAYQTNISGFWYDPKIIGSLIVLLLYAIQLYQKAKQRWHGRRLAWWSAVSFLAMLLNYWISVTGLSFHRWM